MTTLRSFRACDNTKRHSLSRYCQVIAVERYPTETLLEDYGIEATGDLTSFPALGDSMAIANLIVMRREKETQNQGMRKIENVAVSPDGKDLTFRMRTEIEVQKPELLLEQYGVSQLFRITVAKASLSSDGNIMGKPLKNCQANYLCRAQTETNPLYLVRAAVFASALEQDFNNGSDGPALEKAVESFRVAAQS